MIHHVVIDIMTMILYFFSVNRGYTVNNQRRMVYLLVLPISFACQIGACCSHLTLRVLARIGPCLPPRAVWAALAAINHPGGKTMS